MYVGVNYYLRIYVAVTSPYPWNRGVTVFGTEPKCTARYQDLLYTRTGIGCHRSNRNRSRDLWHIEKVIRGVGVPVHPTETHGVLQVESQVLVVQHLYGHHKHGRYIGTYQFLPSQCKLFSYYRLVHDDRYQ